jgi:hypothetical protein
MPHSARAAAVVADVELGSKVLPAQKQKKKMDIRGI